jgi:signal transduction histidine kinase
MKTIASLATLAALLVSWLCFIGTSTNAPRDDRALTTLNQFVATASRLREDILNARLGLLRNYDPLDQETSFLHESLRSLRQDGVSDAVIGPLSRLVDRQEELMERFKSDNALLQNALAYFGLMSGQIDGEGHDENASFAILALSSAVLHLMLDPAPPAARQVQNDLGHLASQAASQHDDIKSGLLSHGQSLHDLLPATDNVLRSLYSLPINTQEDRVRAAILAHQREIRLRAGLYRVGLYAVSLVLLLLLTLLGLQLTSLLQALKRRAAFEHVMTGISMSFVNARAADLQGAVEGALAELAGRIGADRGYFVDSAASQLFTWSRDGARWLKGWPANRPPSLPDIETPLPDIRYVPMIKRMSRGPERDALVAEGLTGWLFISAHGSDSLKYDVGFEALSKPMTWPENDLGPLRMAADNIANAVSRMRLELERARLEASLQHARRMETVGALTSGVAHNFNNVIGAILGHTEMQEAEVHPETRLAEHVQGVRQAAERARDLVEQILHFGRRKEPSEQRVTLSLLLAETEMQLRVALPREVTLLVSCASDSTAVYGDPAQLQQIIMNLCNNASQAMGGAGTIRVLVDERVVSEPLLLSHASLPVGSYVRIVVTDTGCGMTAETLNRLFEPFFTTRSHGNGLGLATAYDIVAGYDGGIDVSSALGQGSTFEVWLPLAARGGSMVPGQGRSLAPGGGETVLVINEDGGRLLHDEDLIAALGYEPVGYLDAACAAAACRSAPERFDVLLVSNVQPAAKALVLAAELHAAARALPIILAAASDDLSAVALAAAGVCEVVKTPLTSAGLACALPRWVSARQLSPG